MWACIPFRLSSVSAIYIYTYMFARVRIKHICIHMYVSAFGLQSLWDTFEISQMLVINLAIIYSLAVA
jgi:hypothetical protein